MWFKYGINCLWNHRRPRIFGVSTLHFCYMKYGLFSWFGQHSINCLPDYSSEFYSCSSSLDFLVVHFPAIILHCLSDIAQCFSHFLFSDVDNIIPLTVIYSMGKYWDLPNTGLPAHGKSWVCADTLAAVLWKCIAEPNVRVWIAAVAH